MNRSRLALSLAFTLIAGSLLAAQATLPRKKL
jgi:hypothetical protein